MFASIPPSITLAANLPSGRTLLALIPLLVVLAGLIVYCLVDLIRARSVRYLPKLAWALIIVLVSAPFGVLAYLVFGKERHGHDLPETVGDDSRPAGERLSGAR